MDQVAPTPRRTILIVDDDAALLNALTFALDVDGFEAHAFPTAAALLASTKARGAACLVIDQKLPDRAGLDLLELLRREGVETPAILITTHPSDSVRARAKALGAPIVEKPLLGEQLFACIRDLIS